MAQLAVVIYREFQDAISDRLADVKSLLVRRDAYSVGVIEVVRYLHPFLTARRKIKNFPNHGGWCWRVGVWAKDRGISPTVGSHHNIIYPAIKLLAAIVGIPSSQLLPVHVEFQDCAGIIRTR